MRPAFLTDLLPGSHRLYFVLVQRQRPMLSGHPLVSLTDHFYREALWECGCGIPAGLSGFLRILPHISVCYMWIRTMPNSIMFKKKPTCVTLKCKNINSVYFTTISQRGRFFKSPAFFQQTCKNAENIPKYATRLSVYVSIVVFVSRPFIWIIYSRSLYLFFLAP